MEVFSEKRASRLMLEVIEGEFIYYPTLNLRITIEEKDFCEARSTAWVTIDDYKEFTASLIQCEQVRQGRAVLSGMSPDEFDLVIENSDSLGHFHLSYKLSKTFHNLRTIQPLTVTGGFDLDAEFFAQAVSDFTELLPSSNLLG